VTDGGPPADDAAGDDASSDDSPDGDVDVSTEAFPIGFWLPPHWDNTAICDAACLQLYAQAAAAGFTFCAQIGFSQDQIKTQLDAYQSAGMTAYVFDARMPGLAWGQHAPAAHPLSTQDEQAMDAIVSDWSGHPAFAGTMLGDEPTSDQFPYLAEISAYFTQKDPAHPTYMNLLPNYGVASSYDAYVEQFLTTVKTGAMSYDNYATDSRFYDNLATISRHARSHGLRFWNIVKTIPGEAVKRWEAMQTLAYGGKGLVFFTYAQFGANGDPAILKLDNTPSAQYAEVKRVNADVRAVGVYLLDAQGLAFGSATTQPTSSDGSLTFATPAEVSYGHFQGKAHSYFFFANRAVAARTRATVGIASGGSPVEHLDKATGEWSTVGDTGAADAVSVALDLAPADGELYRF
jgi:hypothetical protein